MAINLLNPIIVSVNNGDQSSQNNNEANNDTSSGQSCEPNNAANPAYSLLDDFSDLSTEFPDYFGGDD